MRRTRTLSALSAQLVGYLVDQKQLSQSDIARVLDVDKSFVSRVRAGERELSPTQMDVLAQHLGVPLGAMLIDATEPRKGVSKEKRELIDLCARVMRTSDDAAAALQQERLLHTRR